MPSCRKEPFFFSLCSPIYMWSRSNIMNTFVLGRGVLYCCKLLSSNVSPGKPPKKCNIWALGHTHKPSYHLVFRTIFLELTFLGVSTFSQKVEFRLTSLPFALLGSSTKFDHFPIPFKNITDRLLKYDKQTYVDTWYVGG